MKDTELVELLGKVGLFRGLSSEALAVVAEAATTKRVDADEFLWRQDEPAGQFCVVRSGRLRLLQVTPDGHQVIMGFVGPGGGAGIIAVLGRIAYPVSAEVIEDAEILRWDGEAFKVLMLQYPQLAVKGLQLVAGRFGVVMDQLRELSTERVERRIARALLRLAGQMGRRTEEGILIDMALSRQDLAEMTGTTLFTVSRTLKAWEARGVVKLGRKQVCICDAHAMTVIAEDLKEDGS